MADIWVYVVNSGLWTAFGFAAGWVAARTVRNVNEIHEKVVDDDQ